MTLFSTQSQVISVFSYCFDLTFLNLLLPTTVLDSDFEYTKINQFKNGFKIISELAIMGVDQRLSLSISDGWQVDNHISDHRLLGGRWF